MNYLTTPRTPISVNISYYVKKEKAANEVKGPSPLITFTPTRFLDSETNLEMTSMRISPAAVALILVPAFAFAAPPERFYYLGEVKLSNAAGQTTGSQVIVFEKIHDREHSLIVERAVVVQPDGKADERPMFLTVKPDNSFTLVDDAKTVEGTGSLVGPAWGWTYFKANYKIKNGIQIEDENFMADDSVITARKKVMTPDGKIIMYMDMSLKAVTPKTFEILRAGLMRK